jgi:hypothetical protein
VVTSHSEAGKKALPMQTYFPITAKGGTADAVLRAFTRWGRIKKGELPYHL